jgi:hypothetical protein
MKTLDGNMTRLDALKTRESAARRLSSLFSLSPLFLAALLAACSMFGGGDEGDAPRAEGVSFQTGRVTVPVEGSEYLQLFITPSALQKSRSVSWEYDRTKIAVESDTYGAVITGVAEGETHLKAVVDGISASAIVSVQGFAAEYTSDPYLYSNYNVIELTPGSDETVSVSLYGGQSWDLENVAWSIADPSVAILSSSRNNAVIHALKTGSTQLTASHPDCAYGYTMIVYVYADAFAESYLTTDNNIVSVNTADGSPKTLSVSVRNPYGQIRQNAFSWSFVDAAGVESQSSSIISLSPNGDSALVTPLATGLQKLRAAYDECAYPLDILVRVTTTVANVYIAPSTTTLIVTGSAQTYNIYADITGYAGFADPDAFEWTAGASAEDLMEYAAAGNTFSVKGKKNGSVKVKVSHPLSETSRSILIVLQEQAGSAIDAEMYITTSANYVQTQVGADPVEIQVSLAGGLPGDESLFDWRVENGVNNDIARINTPTGSVSARLAGSYSYGKLVISPLNPGSVTISVTHPKTLYSTDILVRVYSEYALLSPPVYLSVDANLVRLLNGSSAQVTASLSSAASDGDENGVAWRSENPSSVSASPSSGAITVLSANGSGSSQTYVTASHQKALSEKRVLVLSADTQQALDQMKGVYADTTYIRVNEGASDTLRLNQFGLSPQDIASIVWTVDKPSVVTVNAAAGNHLEAAITGVSPGNAAASASLSGGASCLFNVTVLPAGESVGLIEAPYLTTAKNAVVFPSAGEGASLSVTGVNISPASMASRTSWLAADPSIVSIAANGPSASLTALAPGRTAVTVSNPDSANSLSIDVKVGALYEWSGDSVVYITAETDVVTMVKGAKKTIGASLANSSSQGGFSFFVSGKPVIEASGTYSGTCLIDALEAGVSEITVRNSRAVEDKHLLVAVANSEDELRGVPYLSTNQNVVTIGETLSATIAVTPRNVDSPLLSGYAWTSSDPAVIEVVSSGQTALFYGRKAGTAKVTVTNDNCPYPLEIIANCVNPVLAAANPYIMTPNIVTLTVGAAANTPVVADLIGGADADKAAFSWFCDDSTIVQLYASNESAQLKALKEGAAQIVVSHPKAHGADRTILVICEPPQTADCYITTSESIIRLSPSDPAKTISAALVNGAAGDSHNFKWWADDYSVIDMSYTGENALVTPLAAGSVTIHVSHPKALYQKDIVLNISQYAEFAFEKTQAALTSGVQSFVNMRVPSTQNKTRVAYSVKKADGSGAPSNIVGASGTSTVCVLDPREPGNAIIEASLVAVNSGAVQATAQLLVSVSSAPSNAPYISFSGSTIITLEKGASLTLSASLMGTGAAAGDDDSLQWKSSDQSVLQIAPVSASLVATRKEVRATAMIAGKEATLAIHHEKANTDITLYFIIPGENAASITLDKNFISFTEGEGPAAVSASIANAAEKDYENLVWTLANDNESSPAASLSGSGKTVSLKPLSAGSAALTAKVPSSGKTASCEIMVERKKQILFSTSSVTVHPGGSVAVGYSVSPASEEASLVWTIGDGSFASFADNHNGSITVIGKDREGSTYLEAASPSGVKARFSLANKWGNTFSLNKTAVSSIPVDNGDGTFTVTYNVSPACAELHISTGSNYLSVSAGASSAQYVNGEYIVYAGNHQNNADPLTGIATGTIRFHPSGETNKTVYLTAYNPMKTKLPDGAFEGADIATKTIAMRVGYDSYTFNPKKESATGKHSKWNDSAGAFVLGDGEALVFSLPIREANAVKKSMTVTFTPNNNNDPSEKAKDAMNISGGARRFQKEYVCNYATGTSSGQFALAPDAQGRYTIYHTRDYGEADAGIYFGVDAASVPAEIGNTAVRAAPLVGTIEIAYVTGIDNSRSYKIPLYVEVRNCTKNHQ